jgi:hypothetical protein
MDPGEEKRRHGRRTQNRMTVPGIVEFHKRTVYAELLTSIDAGLS